MGTKTMTLDESAFSDIDSADLYQEVYDTAYHGADIRPAWIGAHRPRTSVDVLQRLSNWACTHYDYYLNFVREYVERRGDVLDIGCGAGQCTAMLARYADSAVGIDIDPEVIKFANKWNVGNRTTFIYGFFPSKAAGTYDYIFCVETIEHVPYEQQAVFIDRALAMLRPDGRMFITTPNEETPSAPHVGVWSREWMGLMAARLDGRVVRRGYFNNVQPVGFQNEPSTHHAWVLR